MTRAKSMPITQQSPAAQAEVVTMAQALLTTLHHARKRAWHQGGKALPWSEQASETCAKAVIDLVPENERLRARVKHLESVMIGEGRSV